MRIVTLFADDTGRAHDTPEQAAIADIERILNIPAGLAARVLANWAQIDAVAREAGLARIAYADTIDAQLAAPRASRVPPASIIPVNSEGDDNAPL